MISVQVSHEGIVEETFSLNLLFLVEKVYAHTCGGQRYMLNKFFLITLYLYSLREDHPLNEPDVHRHLPRLVHQWTSVICLSLFVCLLALWLHAHAMLRFLHGFGVYSNSLPHICTVGTLLTELSPLPITWILNSEYKYLEMAYYLKMTNSYPY